MLQQMGGDVQPLNVLQEARLRTSMLQMRQKHDALPLYFKAKDEGLRVRWEGATVQVRRGNTWVPY